MNFFWVAAGRRAVSGGAPENRHAGKAGPAKLYSLHLIHLVPRRGNFLEIGSIVERGFAVGSSFPAAVDPKPLVRVGADGGFERVLDALGIDEGISGDADGGIELQDVFPFPWGPDSIARDDGGAGAGGEFCEGRADAGLATEEVHEEAFVEADVLIDQDADGLVGGEGPKDGPDTVGFADDDVAAADAAGVDEGVQKRVIEGADDDVHGLRHEGVGVGGELPVAEVKRGEEDAFALGFGGFIMFEAFVTNPVVDVGLIDAGEAGETDEEASDGAKDAVDDFRVHTGELAVAEGDAAEFGDDAVEDFGVERTEETGRSEGDRGEQDPHEPKLGEVAPLTTQSTRLRGRGRHRRRRHLGRG